MSCVYRYPCVACGKPAQEGKACCSRKCRDSIPNCKTPGCNNAVEAGSIYKGMDMPPSDHCYRHGGRVHYDGDPQHGFRQKRPCIITGYEAKWI